MSIDKPTDKDLVKIEKIIRKHFSKWAWIVTHWGWKVQMIFYDCIDDMPHDLQEEWGVNVAAKAECRWGYARGYIYINLEKCYHTHNSADPDEMLMTLEELVVHELTHLLIAPMEREDTQSGVIEYVTTSVSKALYHLGKEDEIEERDMPTKSEIDRALVTIFPSTDHDQIVDYGIPHERMDKFCRVESDKEQLLKCLQRIIKTIEENYPKKEEK